MITIENNKILIDGIETKNAELIGCAMLDYVESHTELIIFEDE
jgi:hypothetical protein